MTEGRERFAIRRIDGRSNAQVLIDFVKEGPPGRVYTYEELAAALSAGTDREYDVPAVRGAVLRAVHALETLHKRTMANVPQVGYRIVPAHEHMTLACVRNDKANRQMRMGLHTLQNVRYEEMDENARRAHEGHLMITAAIYQQTRALEGRMRKVEAAIMAMKVPGEGAVVTQ